MLYRNILLSIFSLIIVTFLSACGVSSPAGSNAAVPVINVPPGGAALTMTINFPPKPAGLGLMGLVSLNTQRLEISVSNGPTYNPAAIIASTSVIAPPGGGAATGTLIIASAPSTVVSIDIVSRDILGNWIGEVQEVNKTMVIGGSTGIMTTLIEAGQGIDLVALGVASAARPVVYAPDGTSYTVRKVFLKSFKGAAGNTYNMTVESDMASGAVAGITTSDSLFQGAILYSRTNSVASNGVIAGTLAFMNNASTTGKDYTFTLNFGALNNAPTLTVTQSAAGPAAPAPKNTVIIQQWANNINPALMISGKVFAATNMFKATTTPLTGATVIAGNASAATSVSGAYSVNTGVSGDVYLSAAKTGYTAETIMVPVNGPVIQDLNLSPLGAGTTSTVPTGSATVTGVVTLPAFASTTAQVQIMVCDPATGNIVGSGFGFILGASGTYTATVNLYNNLTTGVYTVAAEELSYNPVTMSTTLGSFGYVQGVAVTANASSVTNITTTATNPVNTITVNLPNIPAGIINTNVSIAINLPGGAGKIPFYLPMGTQIVPTIAGATYNISVYADDSTFNPVSGLGTTTMFSTAILTNVSLGTYNVSLLPVPNLVGVASQTSIALPANIPATLIWSPVPGALQYHVELNQGGYNPLNPPANGIGPAATYGWIGVTGGLKVIKPVFSPANGGNLVVGGNYWGTLQATDQVMLGNGPTFHMSPYIVNTQGSVTSRSSGRYFNVVAQ